MSDSLAIVKEVSEVIPFARRACTLDNAVVTTVVHCIRAYELSIPLRTSVTHAASQRAVSEPIVVSVEMRNGRTGYGETLPRSYVTGESNRSVIDAMETVFVPALLSFHPASFPEALELVEALPWTDSAGRSIAAARTAVELALLDAVLRSYARDWDDVVQWMGLASFGRPGSGAIRFSGVLAAGDLPATMRQLRLMYWAGLRHFKIKVGFDGDVERVERVARYLRGPLRRGQATLRVDANSAWTSQTAKAWLAATSHLPIAAVEQPLPRGREEDLGKLRPPDVPARRFIHDESLCNVEDAHRLLDLGVADCFSIRISKCGGMLPSLRLAALARRRHVDIQLGCMVGETSILSAAGVRFLQLCPGVRWAEGCFGSFLMGEDVTMKGVRFGYGGRVPTLNVPTGLGIAVEPNRLERLCPEQPRVFNL